MSYLGISQPQEFPNHINGCLMRVSTDWFCWFCWDNLNRKTMVFTWFYLQMYEAGWWFGTFFIFHNIWDNPSHWLIFFKMVKATKPDEVSCHFCHHPVLRTGLFENSSGDVPRPVPRTRAGRDSLGGSGSACCWGGSDWVSRITNQLACFDYCIIVYPWLG